MANYKEDTDDHNAIIIPSTDELIDNLPKANEAVGSSELACIQLPQKVKGCGKPKGATLTTIGLSKKHVQTKPNKTKARYTFYKETL